MLSIQLFCDLILRLIAVSALERSLMTRRFLTWVSGRQLRLKAYFQSVKREPQYGQNT